MTNSVGDSSRITEAVELVSERALGRVISGAQVTGLITLAQVFDPMALSGQHVTSATASPDGRLAITLTSCELIVDLQRTGRVIWREQTGLWHPGQPVQPTIRLLFTEDALDFAEPGKTKRIRLTVVQGDEPGQCAG